MSTQKTKLYGFAGGNSPDGDSEYIVLSEHGDFVASHISSSENWGKRDLGMYEGSNCNHNLYDEKYPKGWECEYVDFANRDTHEGLQKAIRIYLIKNPANNESVCTSTKLDHESSVITDDEMLLWLEKERIVKVEVKDNSWEFVSFTEQCDRHFTIDLNKQQLGKFIAELQNIHEQMV